MYFTFILDNNLAEYQILCRSIFVFIIQSHCIIILQLPELLWRGWTCLESWFFVCELFWPTRSIYGISAFSVLKLYGDVSWFVSFFIYWALVRFVSVETNVIRFYNIPFYCVLGNFISLIFSLLSEFLLLRLWTS